MASAGNDGLRWVRRRHVPVVVRCSKGSVRLAPFVSITTTACLDEVRCANKLRILLISASSALRASFGMTRRAIFLLRDFGRNVVRARVPLAYRSSYQRGTKLSSRLGWLCFGDFGAFCFAVRFHPSLNCLCSAFQPQRR